MQWICHYFFDEHAKKGVVLRWPRAGGFAIRLENSVLITKVKFFGEFKLHWEELWSILLIIFFRTSWNDFKFWLVHASYSLPEWQAAHSTDFHCTLLSTYGWQLWQMRHEILTPDWQIILTVHITCDNMIIYDDLSYYYWSVVFQRLATFLNKILVYA